MLEVSKPPPQGQALRAIIERYLSTGHANSPGMGCVLAALGPELARKPLSVYHSIKLMTLESLPVRDRRTLAPMALAGELRVQIISYPEVIARGLSRNGQGGDQWRSPLSRLLATRSFRVARYPLRMANSRQP
jgi:hypothetical protein